MTLKIGIIGTRGLSTVLGFNSIQGVRVDALCDLNEELLQEQAKEHNIPKTFRIYEDMLESDIDAVVISTPMQCHFHQVMLALEAGKHVMSEVTAGVAMDELWWLIECVEKYKKVYMMAENYCYIPEVQLIANLVKKGLFGEVYFGEGEYLHDIKNMITYNYGLQASGKISWRKFWHLGKRGNFYPTHSLGPVMKWFSGDRIKSVTCAGTGWHTAPELRQEDTSITICQMESGKLIKLRTDCISERPHNLTYYSLQGTKGCYEAPRGMGDDHKIWLKGMYEDTDKAVWRPLKDFDEYLPDDVIERIACVPSGTYAKDPENVYAKMQQNIGISVLEQYIPTNPLSMGQHGYEYGSFDAATGANVICDGMIIESPEDVVEHLEKYEFPKLIQIDD